MEEMFFNGVWRMDWGLGNPNKTAALIAELMIAVWILAYTRKRAMFWIILPFFTALGFCLVHTFSRGGLIAVVIGLATITFFTPRPWHRKRIAAICVSVLLIIGFAIYLNAHERYVQGFLKKDASVENRLEMWLTTPIMIVDAPDGWGLGNAGEAFMRWYQPVNRHERYRTLVNSHLTWLVEFAWPFRFLYILFWLIVLFVSFPTREARWFSVSMGTWMVFGVAAFFSSIAESIWLWIAPCFLLTAVLLTRVKTKHWPKPTAWPIPVGTALTVCVLILILGQNTNKIKGSSNRVIIGGNHPLIWLVTEEKILGSYGFAKEMRKYLAENSSTATIGIVRSIDFLPNNLSGMTIIIAGLTPEIDQDKIRHMATVVSKIILLSPCCYPDQVKTLFDDRHCVKAVFGEFSQSSFLPSWEKTGRTSKIAGAGDFLQKWPQIIFENILPEM